MTMTHCTFTDDPELFHGLPVGLQLIGRTLEEEGVIGAMTEVVVEALAARELLRALVQHREDALCELLVEAELRLRRHRPRLALRDTPVLLAQEE